MEKKRESGRFIIILIAVIVVIAAASVYFIWQGTYSRTCSDKECFDSALEKCERAVWISETDDASWKNSIIGIDGDNCNVRVTLLQAKKGANELEKLNELEMNCYLPLGYVASPSADLTMCHGLLKEEMQDMIIRKMHSYILTNVGRISEELSKAI